MNQKLLFVVNPIAGGNHKDDVLNTIRQWEKGSGHFCEIWETTGKNDVEKLQKKTKSADMQKVVAVGGDGTLMLCAQALIQTDIPLGFIPSGSANGMAAELLIPEDADEALEIIEKGNTLAADMLCFNNEKYGLHISDIGLNARLIKHFEEDGDRGFFGYAKGAFRELTNLENFKVTLHLDGKEIEETAYMVAFANAKRYGTGALLNNKGKLNDGLFEICVLRRFNPIGIAGHFWDYIDENADHLKTYQAQEVSLKTSRPVSFQIDGELQEDITELKIRVVSACIKLIVP